MSNQVMKKCSECRKPTIHIQPKTSHVLHLLLSLITVGIWVPVWLLIALNNSSQATCTACGTMTGLFGSKRRA